MRSACEQPGRGLQGVAAVVLLALLLLLHFHSRGRGPEGLGSLGRAAFSNLDRRSLIASVGLCGCVLLIFTADQLRQGPLARQGLGLANPDSSLELQTQVLAAEVQAPREAPSAVDFGTPEAPQATVEETPSEGTQVIYGFIEWFGVPFGLIVALVLVNVWLSHARAEKELDDEADQLIRVGGSIRDLNFILGPTAERSQTWRDPYQTERRRLVSRFNRYVAHLKSAECFERESSNGGRNATRSQGDKLMTRLRSGVGELVGRIQWNDPERRGLDQALELQKEVSEAMDRRGDRVCNGAQRVPPLMLLLVVLATSIWLAPFLTMVGPGVGSVFQLHAGLIPMLTITICLALVDLIIVLDSPYSEPMAVDLGAWIASTPSRKPSPGQHGDGAPPRRGRGSSRSTKSPLSPAGAPRAGASGARAPAASPRGWG
jgi:hypothetical protein